MILNLKGVAKAFGHHTALSDITLSIDRPMSVALLGENGAGKSTLLRILATTLKPDRGTVDLLGRSVLDDPHFARRAISLCAQDTTLEPGLTTRQNLMIILRLAGWTRKAAEVRLVKLLANDLFASIADRKIGTLSGGNQRRADILASLASQPTMLILDEPTTGLDPESRARIWTMIREARAHGTTVLFSTQYLEEAERHSDKVIVIGHGKVLAEGTPQQLRERYGQRLLDIAITNPDRLDETVALLAGQAVEGRVIAAAPQGTASLERSLAKLRASTIEIDEVALRHPRLEEIFGMITAQHESSCRK